MTFLYPLGLLGLIGIPLVIIIYIIKNKHTEQIVTSTYLWTLSERFLKKKRHLTFLSGIISLILQILIIGIISLIIAHPVITIANSAKEYCFILDGSGSMNMIQDETTKMEIGKETIEDIIVSSTDGSKYTLIYVGDTTRVVYEKLGDKEKAISLLDKLTPSGLEISYNSALKFVQQYFNDNNSLVSYLITDIDYSSSNIQVINVSKDNNTNNTISDCTYEIVNGYLKIYGKVLAQKNDINITLELIIDDINIDNENLSLEKNIQTDFSFEVNNINFDVIKIAIKENDSLGIDNEYFIYNTKNDHSYKTLIVSDQPYYIQSVLQAVGNNICEIIEPAYYRDSFTGYSLYIYDGFSPSVLPSDGAIWFFGCDESIPGTGFSVQDTIEDENGMLITYPKNSTSLFKLLTNGLSKQDIYAIKYIKYGLYRNFTTLMTHEGNPIAFTGLTDNGCREVVFAFDLHDSNFPLMLDFLTLTKNLIDYSFPIILDKSSFVCGEIVQMNVLSNCDSIRVESPMGKISYLNVNSEIAELTLTETGTYTLTMMFGENKKVFRLFSSLPENESQLDHELQEINLQGEQGNDYSDGIYDKLIIFFIILLLIYIMDWMVYCYEQYQLR